MYFWLHADNEDGEKQGRDLAILWHGWAGGKHHRYDSEDDRGCAVVFVRLVLDEDSILDFDDLDIVADFEIFFDHARKRYDTLEREDLSNIRDEFVAVMEEARKAKYDVVLGTVDIPQDGLPSSHFRRFVRKSRSASVQNTDIAKVLKVEEV